MLRAIFSFCWLFLLAACSASGTTGPVILAASSLQHPLEELADAWAAQGKPRPVLSFAASAALARQIDSGTAADIFISADRTWTDFLVKQGRIDTNRTREIAGNSLVLVANNSRLPQTRNRQDLITDLQAGPIAIGDPETVPLGRYTRTALAKLGVWDNVAKNVVPAASAQQAVRLVSRGETDLGIIYLSDTLDNQHIHTLHQIETPTLIRYVALILPASGHPDAAGFLDFLTTPEARAVLIRHGLHAP